MRAEKIVKTLLGNAAGVVALVGNRVFPGPIPQGTALPAISFEHISTVPQRTLDASAGFNLARTRIEVTAVAKTYGEQKSLVEEIRKALEFQRGTIAGIEVYSVLRDSAGPDLRDDDRQIYTQAVDFFVTYREA